MREGRREGGRKGRTKKRRHETEEPEIKKEKDEGNDKMESFLSGRFSCP